MTFTRGLGRNELFSTGVFFFEDITGIPDPDPANRDREGNPRYNPKNKEGVYRTIGDNKDLNFGMLGLKGSYFTPEGGGSFSIFSYGGWEGALFQDPIHNLMKDQTALFPYIMNNSKLGCELEFTAPVRPGLCNQAHFMESREVSGAGLNPYNAPGSTSSSARRHPPCRRCGSRASSVIEPAENAGQVNR